MGIFKNKFDIKVEQKNLKFIVTKLSQDTIKINAKVVIPQNFQLIIGKKGKALDCFSSGENYFTYSSLPQICRKYHIDKMVDGKQQESIKANLYLIDCGLKAGQFKTYRKVRMGTRAYGFFSCKVIGVYSYRVISPKEFMQSLLNEFDYIRTGEAEDILGSWVDDMVVKELERQNFILSDVISNNPIIANSLKNKLDKLFRVCGLELVEIKITKYKLARKYQKQSDENINKQNEDNMAKTLSNGEPTMEEDAQKESEVHEVEEYVPFGNFKIDNNK